MPIPDKDKCKGCFRYKKCKLIVDEAKEKKLPLLALNAVFLCPLFISQMDKAVERVKATQ